MQCTDVREDEQRLHRERDDQPDEEPPIYPRSGWGVAVQLSCTVGTDTGVPNAVIHR